MQAQHNVTLAPFTAFKVGGPADQLVEINNPKEILQTYQKGLIESNNFWLLGYGTNCLISDKGLNGTVLVMREGGKPELENGLVIADATTRWDNVVTFSIENKMWGLELMSGIPGNVGAGLTGNIAAYGQKIADTFVWADVFDTHQGKNIKLTPDDLKFDYRASALQNKPSLIVLRVAFQLSEQPLHQLKYSSALKIAEELGLNPSDLSQRRRIIMETRKRAGSLYDEREQHQANTAGSFFKNPLVDADQARQLAQYDETGKSVEELMQQSQLHSGSEFRVSAAHALLAAGFQRGQVWKNVRLHPQHVLKIENTGNASAAEIYEVAHEIIETVEEKLGIRLEPEVRFMGEF